MAVRLFILLLIAGTMALPVEASGFRKSERIFTPQVKSGRKSPAIAMKPVKEINPVKRKVIEDAVRDLMNSWNTLDLDKWLGDKFYNRTRLLDVIAKKAPRNATLRIMSIQGIQTLNQYYIQPALSGPATKVISDVSATVQTQLEFNDPDNGFQRRNGTMELFFKVTQEMVPDN